MKIKTVCEAAGLPERAVLTYIAEELLVPDHTEDYLGRKNYDFCEGDAGRLREIAVLRKAGFTVAEIRAMLRQPRDIPPILDQLRGRKEDLILPYPIHIQSVSDLAASLSAGTEHIPLPAEDAQRSIPEILVRTVQRVLLFAAVWVPVAAACIGLAEGIRKFAYPAVNPLGIVMTAAFLVPGALLLLLPKMKIRPGKKDAVKLVLVILCFFCVPICRIMPWAIFSHSITRDFRNYRDLDPECLANRSMLFQEVFPKWPHYFDNVQQPDGSWETVYLDAQYLYHYSNSWDYTYDIIAEWPLDEAEFHKEVARVQAVFDQREHMIQEKGDYTCLIVYSGSPPFEEATTSYTYCIFAYDEENLRVRYIYCDSLDDGEDQPAYLQLDWQ